MNKFDRAIDMHYSVCDIEIVKAHRRQQHGEKTMKRFQYLSYVIEYLPMTKAWIVLDWDYETEQQIGPYHKSKSAAMNWCDSQLG